MLDRAPAPAARRVWRDTAWLGVAFVVALGLFVVRQYQVAGTAGLSSFPLDDSWIHLQFARNLAEGHGFAYNPGVPVAGSTAPLWTLLLAAAFAAFGSHPVLAKLVGIATAIVTALLAERLAERWTNDRALALVTGTATAIAGPLVWGALSGMEVTLAALLVTAALLCHSGGRDAATAAFLALAILARPESLLLIPLCWMARPITTRRTAIMIGAALVCLGPWVAFNLATTGTPLPATASAKVVGGLVGFLAGTRESLATTFLYRPWRFEREWFAWLGSVNVLLPALIVAGLVVSWRRRGRDAALPAAILVLHPIGMALLAPYRGPGFQEGRYSIHLLPLGIAVSLVGLQSIARRPRLRGAVMAVYVAASLIALAPAASRYAWAVQNIDAMQVQLGHWVSAHTRPEARLALNDVGAIAFVSRREIVDLMGLVTPGIIPYRREGEAGVSRYLEGACPDYLIIFPAWFPALAADADRFTPIHRVRLQHNTVAGADEMVVYETAWNRWRAAARPCPGRPMIGTTAEPRIMVRTVP